MPDHPNPPTPAPHNPSAAAPDSADQPVPTDGQSTASGPDKAPHAGKIDNLTALSADWRDWNRRLTKAGQQAEAFALGAVAGCIANLLQERINIELANAITLISTSGLRHIREIKRAKDARRKAKRSRQGKPPPPEQALTDADIDRLPDILNAPEAVVYQMREGRPGEGPSHYLLYLFTPSNEDGRKGKIVIHVNFKASLKVAGEPINTANVLSSAAYVRAGDIIQDGEVLWGEIK